VRNPGGRWTQTIGQIHPADALEHQEAPATSGPTDPPVPSDRSLGLREAASRLLADLQGSEVPLEEVPSKREQLAALRFKLNTRLRNLKVARLTETEEWGEVQACLARIGEALKKMPVPASRVERAEAKPSVSSPGIVEWEAGADASPEVVLTGVVLSGPPTEGAPTEGASEPWQDWDSSGPSRSRAEALAKRVRVLLQAGAERVRSAAPGVIKGIQRAERRLPGGWSGTTALISGAAVACSMFGFFGHGGPGAAGFQVPHHVGQVSSQVVSGRQVEVRWEAAPPQKVVHNFFSPQSSAVNTLGALGLVSDGQANSAAAALTQAGATTHDLGSYVAGVQQVAAQSYNASLRVETYGDAASAQAPISQYLQQGYVVAASVVANGQPRVVTVVGEEGGQLQVRDPDLGNVSIAPAQLTQDMQGGSGFAAFTVESQLVAVPIDGQAPAAPQTHTAPVQPAKPAPAPTGYSKLTAADFAHLTPPNGPLLPGEAQNIRDAFVYLTDPAQGFTPAQAAGLIGNGMWEGMMIPTTQQQGGGPGHGIFQWESPGRWDTLVSWARSQHLDPNALHTQLRFMMYELTQDTSNLPNPATLANVKAAKTPAEAASAFEAGYEGAGAPDVQNRIDGANMVFQAVQHAMGGVA
jgi:hypothetical protein